MESISNRPIVSFAIATYNRKDIVKKLIDNILSFDSDEIEVFVIDNCSTDGTQEQLLSIQDKRLKLLFHNENLFAISSWFDGYEFASGEWIFYVNDRDWINADYIPELISLLCEFKKQNVGFAVAGDRWEENPENEYEIYEAGRETIIEFGLRDQHPTGLIFRNDLWHQIKDRKRYFNQDKYGIYPHGYIEAILGNDYRGAYIHIDICDRSNYKQRLNQMSASTFYGKIKGNEYFLPHKRYELTELCVENMNLINDSMIWKELVLKRYERFFVLSTLSYMTVTKDQVMKRRYGLVDMTVTEQQIYEIGLEFVAKFRKFLDKKNYSWIDKDFLERLKFLENELISNLSQWVDNRKKANKFQLREKVVIFGAGKQGSDAFDYYGSERVIAFCDNSPSKWGKTVHGKKIMSLFDCAERLGYNSTFIITPADLKISVSIANQLNEKELQYKFWE